MCDYYAFACRFWCLPETHHFSSNWISYIVAYIWLITNDGDPSPYEHGVNYSKKFIFISILPLCIMILHKKDFPPVKKSTRKACTDLFVILIIREKWIFLLLNSLNSHHCQQCSPASSLILLKKCYQTLTPWPQCSSVALCSLYSQIGKNCAGVDVIFIRRIEPPQSGTKQSQSQLLNMGAPALFFYRDAMQKKGISLSHL